MGYLIFLIVSNLVLTLVVTNKRGNMSERSIKKITVLATAITAAMVLMAPALLTTGAFAQNPHFVGRQTIDKEVSDDTVTLFASGKVAGLGSETTQVFLTTSAVTVETECDNRGQGANPPGQDATFGPTEGDRVDIQPRNGQITYRDVPLSVTVTAEQAGCPDRMDVLITSALFEDVTVHVIQGGQEITVEFGDVDP
jgi:hypothetical protein